MIDASDCPTCFWGRECKLHAPSEDDFDAPLTEAQFQRLRATSLQVAAFEGAFPVHAAKMRRAEEMGIEFPGW